MICEKCGREFSEEDVEIDLALSGIIGELEPKVADVIGYDPNQCPDCWVPDYTKMK